MALTTGKECSLVCVDVTDPECTLFKRRIEFGDGSAAGKLFLHRNWLQITQEHLAIIKDEKLVLKKHQGYF